MSDQIVAEIGEAVRIKNTSSISGRGPIEADKLYGWLQDLDDGATITITKDREYNDPTDPGGEWRLTVTIEREK